MRKVSYTTDNITGFYRVRIIEWEHDANGDKSLWWETKQLMHVSRFYPAYLALPDCFWVADKAKLVKIAAALAFCNNRKNVCSTAEPSGVLY